MVVDIDGVVATMIKWEHLLGDSFSFDRWREFQKQYGRAALITRGARLVDAALDAEVQIVWSTTRPDSAAADTWEWLRRNDLPAGPILTRHRIKDGQRAAVEVKIRHWYEWLDKFGDRNPIVAWIDDDDAALAALPYNGCPTWHPMHLQRTLVKAHNEPFMATLVNKVIPAPDRLHENLRAHRPEWDAREAAWQAKRSIWWQREQERMRVKKEDQRRRQAEARQSTALRRKYLR